MNSLIDQAKRLASVSDDAGRRELIEGLRALSYSFENPDDTLQRIMYSHLQIAVIRVGIDLKLFDILAASKKSLTIEQLQSKTGGSPVLLGRLLRYLASVGVIAESGKDEFRSTNVTEALAIPGNQAGVHHMFDTVGPQIQELPDFLATKKYQDLTDNTDTPHQVATKSPLPAFLWFAENPSAAAYFNKYMMHRRQGMASWLDVFPVEEELRGWDAGYPAFVDIGGNVGHQCAELMIKYPQLPGKIFLQDLAHPISQALSTPGVVNIVHDAFQPQPIKGSKFYYLRAVLHDWPDEKCQLILSNIITAMDENSAILIDEMVLPDRNVNFYATQIDLTMMTALASMERTYSQWTALLESVDLKINKVYTYTPAIYESVIHVVRK